MGVLNSLFQVALHLPSFVRAELLPRSKGNPVVLTLTMAEEKGMIVDNLIRSSIQIEYDLANENYYTLVLLLLV